MYKREKTVKAEKMKKNPQNPQRPPTIPSFSSSLLDEIYRSIDQGNEKSLNPKTLKDRVLEKQSSAVRENHRRMMNENEIESLTRAYLVENWIERNKCRRKSNQFDSTERNPLFFSSSSSSSSSNLSSEKEFNIKNNPKLATRSIKSEVEEYSYLENYYNLRKNNQGVLKNDENSMKSKSRALKIYSNLKKIKQPISPGGRLTTFLNSLFNNGTPKKSKKNPKASIFTEDSTCSSASSYTRSCMSRNSSKTNQKSSNGNKRTVSFSPMNVIIDENNNRYVYKGNYEKDGILGKGLRKFNEDEDDGMASDSSSDLFELDHLAFSGNNRKCLEELPVYETTRFNTNVAIVNGLIC